jgi:hypothetical protein
MKERPILFSGEMVRAILEGRKTQSRRVISVQPSRPEMKLATVTEGPPNRYGKLFWAMERGQGWDNEYFSNPYGQRGDRLWVRETFCPDWASHGPIYKADGGSAIEAGYSREPRWKPSIHMPRKYSRITLAITGIRVERLQDISEADAQAEGITTKDILDDIAFCNPKAPIVDHPTARNAFIALWQDINGADSWAANPWLWVIEFKRVA